MYFVLFVSYRLLRRGAGLRGEKLSAGIKHLFLYLSIYRSTNLLVLSSFALNLMLLSDIAVVAGRDALLKIHTPESSQEDSSVLALDYCIPSQPQLQYLALD
jgi:hypothetical protein